MIAGLLIVSILLQLSAAVLALRLMPVSRGRTAWVLIASAFTLRALRLIANFYFYFDPAIHYPLVTFDVVVGFVVSLLAAAGTYLITPLFAAFKETDTLREVFINSISHDLRTPVTIIKGYAEYLAEGPAAPALDSESRSGLEAIRHGSEMMEAMIEDLVDAARYDGGQLVITVERVNLAPILTRLINSTVRYAGKERILCDLPPDLPPIAADPSRLERILLNLLTNALKYSSAEEGVTVGARVEGRKIVVTISDQGPGIAAEEIPFLFERYFRAHSSQGHAGVGLGLYITRVLVEAHGGRIWVASEPGKGSTFYFTLPLFGQGSEVSDQRRSAGEDPRPQAPLGAVRRKLPKARGRLLLLLALVAGLAGCIEIVKVDHGRRARALSLSSREMDVPQAQGTRWVAAKNGLLLRAGPSLRDAVIAAIPFGAGVGFVEAVGEPFTVEGEKGRWSRVLYQGQVGYAFGGFLADTQVAVETERKAHAAVEAPPPAVQPEKATEERREPAQAPPASAGNHELAFAYGRNDNSGLVTLRQADFAGELGQLEKDLESKRDAYRNSVVTKGEGEDVDHYLARAQWAKERTLHEIRRYEFNLAKRIYSIYGAKLEIGNYSNILGRLEFLGTTIDFGSARKIDTIPGSTMFRDGFENGRKYAVKMTSEKAASLRENASNLLVRIDFSYTESVSNILDWTRKSYFMPKYLVVYNRRTGEILYECGATQEIEISPDLAAPLQITGKVLFETIH
jgi:signal transduction histidine kinase